MSWGRNRWLAFAGAAVFLTTIFGMLAISVAVNSSSAAEKWAQGAVLLFLYVGFNLIAATAVDEVGKDEADRG